MLTGENISLRLLEREDLELRVKWINDKETNDMFGFDWPASLGKTQNWYNQSLNDGSKVHLVVVDSETNKVIGMAGLIDINYRYKHAEVYITIGDKNFRGKGLGKEVLDLINQYGFIDLGLERLYAYNFTYNIPSQKIFEKAGYIKEGIMRKHKYKNGELRDINFYGLLREEWRSEHV
ncbi:GNAT family protein [Turicibacter sanguinis]|uniref:GNAT family N-acetyltransferase n=1 Tax=Turicibacter sanguinis TaxID=154288 RepID=UPI00189B7B7F|nr:GNAT family protein [Turicibacter sanguinis]MDB8555540.1 GNAT family protein [Turicibacter sanguinis]